jgi:hypothetical protein
MCTKLTHGESKNCTCNLAQFCKRRQQLDTPETRAAAFFAGQPVKTNSLATPLAPVYQLITNDAGSLLKSVS